MSATVAGATATQPPEHDSWCSGRCGLWAGTNTPACQPYPCRCNAYKAKKPAWGRDRCWWVKKTTGRTISECPCWGQVRNDKPASCCVHHPANPRYAPPPAPRSLDDLDVAPLLDFDRDHDRGRPVVDVALLDWNGFDPEVEHAPYERRWAAAELTCGCPTPFDEQKPARGWHCASCCSNFTSYAVGEVHRRRWTEPCRPPDTVRDVDTGFALLRQGADGVWSAAYPTAAKALH